MGPAAIAKGVREGWLVAEDGDEGWHRFVWDFELDPASGRWVKRPAASAKRVRVIAAR